MRGFYKDPTRPTGWNNTAFNKVGMPHPLWQQQGVQAVELDGKGQPVMVKDEHGQDVPKLYWESTGSMTRKTPDGKVITKEYDDYARDLVAFMVYMGEPAQVERKQIGYAVLIFLFAVMLPLAYFLKKDTERRSLSCLTKFKRRRFLRFFYFSPIKHHDITNLWYFQTALCIILLIFKHIISALADYFFSI